MTCWYHHWTLGGSREPHRLRYLLCETLTDVVPGPNYSLDPTFNDAEILHRVIEEHVTCWYHHWTLGGSREPHRLRYGSREPHRLRYFLCETLTDVVPGPNYSLDPTFNDAEILHGVIEEHTTCWYHHWTLEGSTEPHRLRYFLCDTLTEVVPGPDQTLDPPFSEAEVFIWVIKEHVTC